MSFLYDLFIYRLSHLYLNNILDNEFSWIRSQKFQVRMIQIKNFSATPFFQYPVPFLISDQFHYLYTCISKETDAEAWKYLPVFMPVCVSLHLPSTGSWVIHIVMQLYTFFIFLSKMFLKTFEAFPNFTWPSVSMQQAP